VALAKKQKKHQNGRVLLGDNVKKNGKHRLHKAGKVDVSVDVSNGKVVGLTAAHPTKGNLQVRKVKSRQKLTDTQPAVDPDRHANGSVCRLALRLVVCR